MPLPKTFGDGSIMIVCAFVIRASLSILIFHRFDYVRSAIPVRAMPEHVKALSKHVRALSKHVRAMPKHVGPKLSRFDLPSPEDPYPFHSLPHGPSPLELLMQREMPPHEPQVSQQLYV